MKLITSIHFASIIIAAVSVSGDEHFGRYLKTSKSKSSKKTRAPTRPSTESPKVNVNCGDSLRKDVILLEDLTCDCQRSPNSTFAALTVVGPASLDLNGFSVVCDDNSWDVTETDLSAVIKVGGRSGVIINGSISGGNFGIVLAERGRHTVENVIVTDTANDGLQVNAPFCEVASCEFLRNGQGLYPLPTLLDECDGDLTDCKFIRKECPDVFDPLNTDTVPCFNGDVSGDAIDIGEDSRYSVVQSNIISNYGDDGISCRGDFNVIRDNKVSIDDNSPRTSKSEDAITVRGVGNQVIDNKISNSIKDGIDVKFNEDDDNCNQTFTGGFNIIRSNDVEAAVDGKGIKIGSNNNFVVLNKVESNIEDEGFNVDNGDCKIGGNRNYMADNVSNNNDGDGFKIEETNNNVIVRNTATGNKKGGFVLEVKEESSSSSDSSDEGDEGEIRGLANILAGNIATENESGKDIREKGKASKGDCSQNAYIGNIATSDTDADPFCTLGEQIDLALQDEKVSG